MTVNKDMHLVKDFFNTDMAPTRDGFGHGIIELGKKNKNVVALCCDLAGSTRVDWFMKEFPDRFFQVGVAEQNMMGLAAGLSMVGKVPFASSYAAFNPGRNWDQVRVSVCYQKANVKIVGSHGGISVGPDGATHQALEDVASVRCLPNMNVIIPADSLQAKQATIVAGETDGPFYLRFTRDKVNVITTDKTPFKLGEAQVFKDGTDVAIVACGIMVCEALKAARELEKEGISAMVINNHTVKPIDRKTLTEAAKKCGCVVTAEEHQIQGGMGSAVAEVLAEEYPVPMRFVGILDRFGESGKPEELMKEFNVTHEDVVKAVKDVIKAKK